jgi:hypothetical protein
MFLAIAHLSEEWLKMFFVIMGVTIARAAVNGPPPPPPPFPGLPFLLPVTKDLDKDKE